MGPPPAGIEQFQQVFLRIIGLSVGVGFVVLLVMLVTGGIKYLVSGGDQKAMHSAKQTLTWAVIGMVFFALAWLALQLVGAISGNLDQITHVCFSLNC